MGFGVFLFLIYWHDDSMKRFLIISLISGGSIFSSLTEPAVTPENFEALHQLMQPRADELKWKTIPWHSNLWGARIEAAEKGKPIYLWEMDGHPLGCT